MSSAGSADQRELRREAEGAPQSSRWYLSMHINACRTRIGVLLLSAFAVQPMRGQAAIGNRPAPNDAVPFAPLDQPSTFWVGWPTGAMYEGDARLPVHLWSRTAQIAAMGTHGPQADHPSYSCFPSIIERVVKTVMPTVVDKPSSGYVARGCTLAFVPRFVIRQLTSQSSPVSTPTFNPAFEFTEYAMTVEDSAAHAARVRRGSSDPETDTATILVDLEGAHLRFGHYSNGQAGCLYADETGDDCARGPGGAGADTLNTTNGSFSTDYIEFGATSASIFVGPDGRETERVTGAANIRYNPPGLGFAGGMSADEARTYRRASVELMGTFETHGGRTRPTSITPVEGFSLDGLCALVRPSPYRSCQGAATGYVYFPLLYGFGLSAKYVTGWDYYNVDYGRRLKNPSLKLPIVGIVLVHHQTLTMPTAAQSTTSVTQSR